MDAGPSPAPSAAPSPFDDDALMPPKSLHDDARFDVTAMVDLVFMMNIFFLVTWAEMARAEIDLPRAKRCVAAERSRSLVFTLVKSEKVSTATVFLGDGVGGTPLSPGEIESRVAAAIEAAKRGAGGEEPKDIVLIKAEKEVRLRDIARLSGLVSAAGGMKLMLAVIEKQ
jgi:biopolymer transport protein ExbD